MTDNDLEIAQPDDFFVKRDAEDNLQAVTQKIPGVQEHLRVVPMTMGDVNEYGLDEGLDLDDEDLADIFNNHLADLEEDITADDVSDNMIGFGRDALLQTILRASGYDMQNAINIEQFEMLSELDEGNFQRILEMAEAQQ